VLYSSIRHIACTYGGVLVACAQGPHQTPGQPFKFTVTESCDRIKEEFSFIQAQYHRSVDFTLTELLLYIFHRRLANCLKTFDF